jgi:hypothetical protein
MLAECGRHEGAFAAAVDVASKFDISGTTRTMCAELGKHTIQVNAVAPCMTLTPFTSHMFQDPENVRRIRIARPVGREAEPKEIDAPSCSCWRMMRALSCAPLFPSAAEAWRVFLRTKCGGGRMMRCSFAASRVLRDPYHGAQRMTWWPVLDKAGRVPTGSRPFMPPSSCC